MSDVNYDIHMVMYGTPAALSAMKAFALMNDCEFFNQYRQKGRWSKITNLYPTGDRTNGTKAVDWRLWEIDMLDRKRWYTGEDYDAWRSLHETVLKNRRTHRWHWYWEYVVIKYEMGVQTDVTARYHRDALKLIDTTVRVLDHVNMKTDARPERKTT